MDIMGMIQNLLGQKKQQPLAPGVKSPLPQNQNPGGFNSPMQPGLNAYYQREGQANSITPQQGMAAIQQKTAPAPQVLGTSQPSMSQSAPTPTPTPSEPPSKVAENIYNGFIKYGVPQMAKYAHYFAQAGQGLPDPYMPAVLAIKETSGGKRMAHQNNVLNIGPNIDYPDIPTNLVGGQGHKGFVGVIKNGMYKKYLQSGKLEDFFPTYTPTYDQSGKQVNGTVPDQIKEYNTYKNIFTGQ